MVITFPIITVPYQFLAVTLCFLLSFFFQRGFLWSVKNYYLNTSARKKRAKGQTFKEWFFYTRYRNEIPKLLLWLYFFSVIFHLLVLVCIAVAAAVEPFQILTSLFTRIIFFYDKAFILLIGILFWQPRGGFKIDRWISKPKRKKKK